MGQGVLDLHSYWAFAVLVLLLLATVNAFIGLSSKRAFLPKDRQISMLALIFTHVQFVIGLVLLFVSAKMDAAKQLGMGGVMKNPELRKLLVEHPAINLIAIILITIGWSTHKRAEDSTVKFKKIAIFYAIGLVLLLSRIPWGQWLS
jgi:cytochrome bd-type quinol oxidase subunit 2